MKRSAKFVERVAIALAFLGALVMVALLQFFPWTSGLERVSYDYFLRIRGRQIPHADVVIVSMDESSQKELGLLPWDRRVHAELLKKLKEGGARMAVFDVLFDSEKPEADPAFAAAIKDFGQVVLGQDLNQTSDPRFAMVQTVEPVPIFFEAGATAGFVSTPMDEDKVRRANWLVRGERTLATEALFRLTGQEISFRDDVAYLGDQKVPALGPPEQPSFLINYVGPSRTIPTQSYYQVLDGTIPPGFLKDKIVFIGADLVAENKTGGPGVDRFSTPVDKIDPNPVLMPGVEIHANALQTILARSFIREASPATLWLLVLSLGVITAVYATKLKPLPAGTATLATLVVTGIIFYWVFVRYRAWVSPIQGIFMIALTYTGITVVRFRLAYKERAQIQKAFKHYVSVEVLGELMKNPDSLGLGGTEVDASVLFCDIAGFSKMSERISPTELVQMLNVYFETLGSLIMREKGMVNKFIGDAVMAIWGAPLENPRHAIQACQASLDMQRAMIVMDPVKCRVGLNSGKMIAGNMGSSERFEYTVIGDTVNLSSRLEGVNKSYGTDILISEMTEERVRGHFLVREVDSIRVVGKQKPVRIYQLLDSSANSETPEHQRWIEMIASFQPAHEAYRARTWQEAVALFVQHLVLFPEDSVGKVYLGRCQYFCEHPPAEDWDGVYQMETK